jgi:hypothetical protein
MKFFKIIPWFAWLLIECTPPGNTLHKHFRSPVFTNIKLHNYTNRHVKVIHPVLTNIKLHNYTNTNVKVI